ncbi:nuclear distribution protein nudF [Apodospora peruviana]|uniref:Nuclear distribution protein PAC1 n=1 Tax=Apodospora peruviana TaxID=516989 RepID=A0AAE0HYM4_9PEZI|nr:nuclear distribution protein nudF [Apodospora peruviana]
MSHLTSRQAEELYVQSRQPPSKPQVWLTFGYPVFRHKSIIAYLTKQNLTATAPALRTELDLGEDRFDSSTAKKYENLLERKWTSVVRLQKKVMDLESQIAALQFELDNATPASLSTRNKDASSWLPKAPPRYTLESHRNTINCIAFHPIFSSLATGSDDCTIKIWDWDAGELERTVKGHTRAVSDVDYGGPRGNTLLASCSADLSIKLWDPVDDYKNVRTLLGHDHSVSAVRFIPASTNLLVSASRDMTLRIWDVSTGFCVRTHRGHTAWVRDVFPSSDGRYLLSAGDDMTVRLWDMSAVATRTESSKLSLLGHEHYIECCALAPPTTYQYLAPMAGLKKVPPARSSAEFMATGSRDKTIRLWSARGTCVMTLVGHDNWVRALVFHPGGKYLLSASDDKTVRCWDLSQEGRCVKIIKEPHERFVTALRWAPHIVRSSVEHLESAAPSTAAPATPERSHDGQQLDNTRTTGDSWKNSSPAGNQSQNVQIRCVVATGGVDCKLRIFAT